MWLLKIYDFIYIQPTYIASGYFMKSAVKGLTALHFICFATNSICGELSEDYLFLEEKVFTPAVMEQSVADTPGAITIITGEQIRSLGIKSIAETLRLVPGFNVEYNSPFAYVNRGTNYPTGRRLQVLIDGVSEVNPLVGIVNYENIPVAIENIQRIEVVRSQSSSSYGANGFYGAINIITKHPIDTLGTTFIGNGSQNGWSAYFNEAIKTGNTVVGIDYRQEFYDRFETFDDESVERNDDLSMKMASIRSDTLLDSGNRLNFFLAGTNGLMEQDIAKTAYGVDYPVPSIDTYVVSTKYQINTNSHIVNIGAYVYDKDWDYSWEVCGPKAFYYPPLGSLYRDNPELVIAGLTGQPLPAADFLHLFRLGQILMTLSQDPTSFEPVCGIANVDYRYRTQSATINDIWTVSSNLRVSTSIQIDYKSMESEAYGDGKTSLEKSKFFTNAEYRSNDWTLNGGFFVESLGYGFSEAQVSPRIGVNYHLDDQNTLKFIISEGRRLIDGIEIIEHNQIPTHFDQEVYGSTRQSAFFGFFPVYSNKNHVEKIGSMELIYYSQLSAFNLEARIFSENLTNIFNYQDLYDNPITRLNRKGLELTLEKYLGSILWRVASYYMDSTSSDDVDFDEYSLYGGSVYFIKRFNNRITTTLAFYGTSRAELPSGRAYDEYNRIDLRIARDFKFGEGDLEISAMLSHHHDDYIYGERTPGVVDSGRREYSDEITLGLNVQF